MERNNREKDQTAKHLTRVWMKGQRLNRRIEPSVKGWLKGNKWQKQRQSLKKAVTNEPFEGDRKPTLCKGEREISLWGRVRFSPFFSEGNLQHRPHHTLRCLLIRHLYDDSYWPTCMLHLSLSARLSSDSCHRMPLMAEDQYSRSETPFPSSSAWYCAFFFI